MSLEKLKDLRKKFVVEDREPIFKYGDIVKVITDDKDGLDYLIVGIKLLTHNNSYTYDTIDSDGNDHFSYETDIVLHDKKVW